MSKYRIKYEVPWRRVIGCLQMHLSGDLRACERWAKVRDRYPEVYEGNLQALRKSYEAHHQLRLFLGYRRQTKCELAALEFLEE